MIDLANLDFSWLPRFSTPLLWGLWTTLWLGVAGFLIAIPSGLLLALGRLRGGWFVRWPILAFVDVVRFTPLLVQAVWIHFALPALTGHSLTPNQSGLIALSLHVSAYVCEIMRAGITAIPPGQWEAARALGLRPRATFRLVILPQVWPLVLPPLANVAVATFKLTAILGIIAVSDLTKAASRINTFIFRPLEVYTVVALIYLAIGLLLAWGAYLIERRYGARGRERAGAAAALRLDPAVEGSRHGA
jgi:His/Glu/Gln/Arg/opine family amino acid ABC transporter permease subunit